MANPEDFELDYYDYNVINAGAAPGSYLGMDPAYLVWIPPLDGGDIIQEIDDEAEPHYEEILPTYRQRIETTAIPSDDEDDGVPNLPPLNQLMKPSLSENKNQKNSEISKILAAATLCDDSLNDSSRRSSSSGCSSSGGSGGCGSSSGIRGQKTYSSDLIQMQEFPTTTGSKPLQITKNRNNKSSPARVHQPTRRKTVKSSDEKETAVVKTVIKENAKDGYYELDDIQFADDEEEITFFGGESSNDNKKAATILRNGHQQQQQHDNNQVKL